MKYTNRSGSTASTILITLGIIAALFILGLFLSVTVIGKGKNGVVASFGNVEETLLVPGLHFVAPWKTVYKMDAQIQKDEEQAATPTKEGMTCHINSILLWRVDPAKMVEIAKQYGHDNYEDRLVRPHFRGVIRDVTVQFDAESLYTKDRSAVEAMIFEKASKILAAHGIVTESITLTNLDLPPTVKERIEAKVAAEQDVKRMEFLKKQETIKGEIKVIEATAIAKAQNIIKQDLDTNYLRYLWIQSLKEKGNSLIYVPIGHDGLPIFTQVEKKVQP